MEPERQQVGLAAVDPGVDQGLREVVPDVGVVEDLGDRLQMAVLEHGLGSGPGPVGEHVGRLAAGQGDEDLVLERLVLDRADDGLAGLERGVDVEDSLLAEVRSVVVGDFDLACA